MRALTRWTARGELSFIARAQKHTKASARRDKTCSQIGGPADSNREAQFSSKSLPQPVLCWHGRDCSESVNDNRKFEKLNDGDEYEC